MTGRGSLRAVVALAALAGGGAALHGWAPDPFAFLAPAIEVTRAQRAALDAGETIARALPGDDGHLAVFAAARINATPDALITWASAIEAMQRGPMTRAIGRFSDPPSETDLDGLVLDPSDLDALLRCRPGSCRVKLAAAEIESVQQAIAHAGPDHRTAAEQAFRRVLIARVRAHRDHGLTSLMPYADRDRPASIYEAFASVVTRSPYLVTRLPQLVTALQAPSLAQIAGSSSYYYWSTEHFGSGKLVVTVTHVRSWMPTDTGRAPAAVMASTQVFASHYINGTLALTMVVCEPDGPPCYLAYVNRAQTDLFGGLFGGIRRSVARQRLESQAPKLISALRDRLQTAPPVR